MKKFLNILVAALMIAGATGHWQIPGFAKGEADPKEGVKVVYNNEENEEEELELNPPGHEAVARRAVCLAALVMRCEFEKTIQDAPRMSQDQAVAAAVVQMHEEIADNLQAWLKKEGLYDSLSDNEKRDFSTKPGKWSERQLIDASWRDESLGVMLWGLSVINEVPLYDTKFGQKEMISKAGLMKPFQDFFIKTKLRSYEELSGKRDVAEMWHWRVRTSQLLKEDAEFREKAGDIDSIIKLASEKSYQDGEIPAPIQDDFPFAGKAFKDLDEAEFIHAQSIAMERHYAFNWLCGYSEDWDDVPTDT